MKNKEIEELLNYIDQFVYVDQTYNDIKLSKIDCKLILSHIEQLEQCYCNRTDCSSRIKDSKKYDSLLQKYKQLENNRDKAIEFIKEVISSTKGVLNDYSYNKEHNNLVIELLKEDIEMYKNILNLLKGDSDE